MATAAPKKIYLLVSRQYPRSRSQPSFRPRLQWPVKPAIAGTLAASSSTASALHLGSTVRPIDATVTHVRTTRSLKASARRPCNRHLTSHRTPSGQRSAAMRIRKERATRRTLQRPKHKRWLCRTRVEGTKEWGSQTLLMPGRKNSMQRAAHARNPPVLRSTANASSRASCALRFASASIVRTMSIRLSEEQSWTISRFHLALQTFNSNRARGPRLRSFRTSKRARRSSSEMATVPRNQILRSR